MTNPIGTALGAGFTAQQVLQFLMRQFPNQTKQIKKAIASGFTAEQIAKYIGGGRKELSEEGLTEHEKTMQIDRRRRENVNKGAAGLAATGLGLAGATIGGPMIARAAQGALTRALPNSLIGAFGGAPPLNPTPTGPLGPSPSGMTGIPNSIPSGIQPSPPNAPASQAPTPQMLQLANQGLNPPQTSTSQPPVSPNLTQTPDIQQPERNPLQKEMPKAADILENLGLRKKAEELRIKKKSPEIIKSVLGKLLKGKDGANYAEMVKRGEAPPFQELIDQFLAEPATMAYGELPEGKQREFKGLLEPVEPREFKPEESQIPEEGRPPIAKSSLVATPHGTGEVKEIRNGKAIVEVDGKKHQIDEDELIQSPITEDELADLFDDMIAGIEKSTGKEVSKHVEFAGYDPKNNELLYKPHGSDKSYAYDNISPEDVSLLTNLLTLRKTTGENYIGGWEANTESPIGAAMHKLIMKLQKERGGKGNEYRNRYETIYDAIEPAKMAAKKRYAERKKKAKKSGLA